MKTFIGLLFAFVVFPSLGFAKVIDTNSLHIAQAPDWLTRPRVEKVTDRIQTLLEWHIRKIQVVWHTDQNEFEKNHGFGPTVLAYARRSDNKIHIGPRINSENFDQTFGHELVHIISFQKYKDAIPKWLEEGLANHLAKKGKVDYEWLASRPFPSDVTQLTHPFSGTTLDISYHYMASQALAEMIAKKCELQSLLQLSVQRKLENYLKTYCGFNDLTADYKKWVLSKAGK